MPPQVMLDCSNGKRLSPQFSGSLRRRNSSRPSSQELGIKCVLVGDGAVGKTSLVVSYTINGYPTEYQPTALDTYSVQVLVDEAPVRIQLCDTAGQEDFDHLRSLCYPETDVFLVCFSVVNPSSFQNVTEKWIPEIRTHSPHTPVVLVGTQTDLRDDVNVLINLNRYRVKPVSESQAQAVAQKIRAHTYVECSALTQKNLKEVFDTAILSAIEHKVRLEKKLSSKGFKRLSNADGRNISALFKSTQLHLTLHSLNYLSAFGDSTMITRMQERWFPLRQSEYSLNFFQMVSCTCPLHMREGLTPHLLLQPNHVFSW